MWVRLGMTNDVSSWVIVATCIVSAWWVKAPSPAAPPVLSHEAAPPISCDSELRQLLDSRALVEHYRLLLLAGCGVVGVLLALIGCLGACLLGCCPVCRRKAVAKPAAVTKRGDRDLLALLAAAEVRR